MSDAVATPALHRSFLSWKDGYFGKLALLISVAAILVYAIDRPDGPPNGGTLLGYFLGTCGLLLIVWLGWFGIRRRRYGGVGRLQGLLSAHVYFGLALIVIATLHTGFNLHWNVHGLAFMLMVAVVASGAFGAYAFWRYPTLMTANRGGATLTTMSTELAAVDARCAELALDFPDDLAALVATALARPDAAGKRPAPPAMGPTLAAINGVQQELGKLQGTPPAEVLALVQALTARVALLERLHRDRRYRAMMLLWRTVHVPLTLGLLVALFVHVFAVFFYW
jgi:hypothetical protein